MKLNNLVTKLKYSLFAITNPVLPKEGSLTEINKSGGPLASLMARLWQTMVIIGSLLVILYFVWGAIDWLTAGGNEEKLKKARGRMVDAFIGLALLVASYAIMRFMEFVFGFSLVDIKWPNVLANP